MIRCGRRARLLTGASLRNGAERQTQQRQDRGLHVESSCLTQLCFFSPENGIITGTAQVVSEENICPPGVTISTPVYEIVITRDVILTLWSGKSAISEFVGICVDWKINFLLTSHCPICVLSPKTQNCVCSDIPSPKEPVFLRKLLRYDTWVSTP